MEKEIVRLAEELGMDPEAVRLLADEELAGMVRGRRRSVERILKTMDEALGRQAEAGGAENAVVVLSVFYRAAADHLFCRLSSMPHFQR